MFGDLCNIGNIGGLSKYWHVLALETKVPHRKPLRVEAFNTALVLWRADKKSNKIFAMLDFCPHRGTPLSAGTIQEGRIRCPYHGWEFSNSGQCAKVPSLGGQAVKNICVPTIETKIQEGFVWGWFGPNAEKSKVEVPKINPETSQTSQPHSNLMTKPLKLKYHVREFDCPVNDLLENFIDSAHTSIVHPGLIRGHGQPKARAVSFTAEEDGLDLSHEPVRERLGPLQLLGLRQPELVSHIDRFSLPSIIRVEYKIAQRYRFLAWIFCTPIDENRTRAFVVLGLNYGLWSRPFISIISRLARTVLKQDQTIVALQNRNRLFFDKNSATTPTDFQIKEHKMPLDIAYEYMRLLRKDSKNGQKTPKTPSRTWELFF